MKPHPELLEAKATTCDFERHSSVHDMWSCRVTHNDIPLLTLTRNSEEL